MSIVVKLIRRWSRHTQQMPKELCALDGCSKKLMLTAFPCKCSKKYCDLHRHSVSHSCPFDYKLSGQAFLLKTMSTAVVSAKLERV